MSSLSTSFTTSSGTTLSATLSSTGGADANVTYFWGDEDGGTTSAGWDHNYTFPGAQGVGTLTRAVTGFIPSNQYYFRARAANVAGTTWSAPYAFSTTANNAPTAITPSGALSIVENLAIGSVIADFNATDQDAGASFTFSLVNGAGDAGNAFFTMESNGTLKSAVVFDFETNATTQPIRVRVLDDYNASYESTFNVSITDDGLHDGAAEVFTVTGGQFGSPYYTFQDSNGQTPNFDTLTLIKGSTYMFVNGGVSGSHPFMIGESFGDTSSSHVFGGPLNASSVGSKITMVIPSDFSGTLLYYCTAHSSMQKAFLIGNAFTNTTPSNLAASVLTVAENEAIGTVVGEVNATDPDAGATLSYSLVSGVGDGNNSLFTLETNGTLKTAVTFDYESNASTYAIRVEAKDDYNATVEGNFTVALTNVNEPPSISSDGAGSTASLSVAENQTAVTTVSGIDPDSGTTLTFSISGGADQAKFQIASATGVLSFLSAPDYENPTDAGGDNGYEVTVRASDGILYDEQTITVTVTDVFENTGPSNLVASVLTVAENEAIGTVVGEVNATDPDAGATLSYSLVSGVGDGNNSLFTLETNGTLKTAVTFDYESNASTYAIRVEAKDDYNATVEGNFTVALTNVNEPPSISSDGAGSTASLSVAENQTAVTTVSGIDPDSGTTLIFSISGGADQAKFQIASATGVLSFWRSRLREPHGCGSGQRIRSHGSGERWDPL